MKKIMLALSFALLIFLTPSAISAQSNCLDFVYLYIDMEDRGGFVEVYYVDSDGKSRSKTFKRESGYVFIDTDYAVLLIARPYEDYYFLGWGDDDLRRHSVEISVCEDMFLVPRFQRIRGYYDDDDDYYSCFIQSLLFF